MFESLNNIFDNCNNMIRPLVISFSYLIDRSTNGQIQRVFWEYCYDKGIRPTIFCSKSKDNDVPLSSLKCKVISKYDNQLIRYIVAFLKRVFSADYAFLPDYSYFSWAKISAIRGVKKELAKGNYDYIYSLSAPCSGHLVALEAKKTSGLPWVASFYDPWYDNPYRPIKNKRFKERDKKMEEAIAKNADVILHISQAVYDDWVERYGEWIKEKMFVLPIVFHQEKVHKHNLLSDKNKIKFVISHIGSLFPGRDSVDFLKSLHMMLTRNPDLINQIELNYVGTVTDEDRKYVKESGLSNIVNYAGYLSEKECEEYFAKTDLFLAIDGKNAKNIFFPSKIMKYFYYGKPILGITPKHSALQYELEKSNNSYFDNEDYEGISNYLYKVITNDKSLAQIDTEYWKAFTMEKVYPKYINILTKIGNNKLNNK